MMNRARRASNTLLSICDKSLESKQIEYMPTGQPSQIRGTHACLCSLILHSKNTYGKISRTVSC